MLSALGHLLAAATKSKQANDTWQCDHPAPMETAFDATRYMGKWYGQLHTANQAHQSDLDKCVTVEYTDLDTDYDNYSIVYSCDGHEMLALWIMSREPQISDE